MKPAIVGFELILHSLLVCTDCYGPTEAYVERAGELALAGKRVTVTGWLIPATVTVSARLTRSTLTSTAERPMISHAIHVIWRHGGCQKVKGVYREDRGCGHMADIKAEWTE